MAPVGTAVVAMAAKKHAVPFVVLVGLHKLSPLYPHDPDVTFNEFKSPAAVVDYDVVAEPLEQHAATMLEASSATSELPASCVSSRPAHCCTLKDIFCRLDAGKYQQADSGIATTDVLLYGRFACGAVLSPTCMHIQHLPACRMRSDQSLVARRFVHVHSPAFDYIAPELISLFVTDTGGYTPSYVYRLLAEYYSSQDLRMLDDFTH